jgi:nucleotide-binding universal stress UspA family protein
MSRFRKILVTTDFSDTSARACPLALMLAEAMGCEIVLVHVEDDRFPPLVVEYMAVGLEDIRNRQVEHSRKQLAEFAERNFPGRAVRQEVVLGVPHAEIVRLAQEQGIDLIVMATHGRGFISHAIMGSTTERVLRQTPCPVLVARG